MRHAKFYTRNTSSYVDTKRLLQVTARSHGTRTVKLSTLTVETLTPGPGVLAPVYLIPLFLA